MHSLLGQFYSRIKGSQEDIASEGLTYILRQSKSARLAVNKIVKSDCGLDFTDLYFTTQNTGDKLERPDISGHDSNGKEVLIFEAKFWASLTENQPMEYLNRLEENSALIFICPTLRVRPIFGELLKRVTLAQVNFTQNPETHSIIFDQNKHLTVKTWNELLGTIKLQLIQNNERYMISDVDQIIGLCDTIDSNAFLPIESEDLSPKHAIRINSYYDLVDKVVDELRKRGIANTLGLKATPQRCGYTRYLKTRHFGISLNLKFDLWASCGDTPFWLTIKDITSEKYWAISEEFRGACKKIAGQFGFTLHETNNKEMFFGLFPLLDKTEDIVITDFADQIVQLTTNLENQMSGNRKV